MNKSCTLTAGMLISYTRLPLDMTDIFQQYFGSARLQLKSTQADLRRLRHESDFTIK
jgi:hypothetical protein